MLAVFAPTHLSSVCLLWRRISSHQLPFLLLFFRIELFALGLLSRVWSCHQSDLLQTASDRVLPFCCLNCDFQRPKKKNYILDNVTFTPLNRNSDCVFWSLWKQSLLKPGSRGREEQGADWGWDGGMASLTPWTWVCASSGSWWWTGRPGALRFMGSPRVLLFLLSSSCVSLFFFNIQNLNFSLIKESCFFFF